MILSRDETKRVLDVMDAVTDLNSDVLGQSLLIGTVEIIDETGVPVCRLELDEGDTMQLTEAKS